MLTLTAGGLFHSETGEHDRQGPQEERPVIHAASYEVLEVSSGVARPLVEAWHYARGMGNATHSFLLVSRSCGTPLAVAVFNPPSLGAAKLMASGVCEHQAVMNLSRLSFSPQAPKNAGSFLLARAVRALPQRWKVVSTYADVAQNVVGVTYQGANFAYLGQSSARPVWTRGGQQVSTQRGGKTLTHAQMQDEGCVIAARAPMHRYRMVRGQAPVQGPQGYPRPQVRLLE